MSTAHSQNYQYQASQRLFIGGLAAPSCETTFSGSQQSDWHLAIVGATSSPSLLLATFAFTSLLASAFVHPGSWQGLKESTAIERWWKMDRDGQGSRAASALAFTIGFRSLSLEQHLGPQHHSFSHGSHPPCSADADLKLTGSEHLWSILMIFIYLYMPYDPYMIHMQISAVKSVKLLVSACAALCLSTGPSPDKTRPTAFR